MHTLCPPCLTSGAVEYVDDDCRRRDVDSNRAHPERVQVPCAQDQKSEPFTYNRYRRELRHLWSSRTPVYETPTVATAAMITSATSKVAMDRP